MLNARSGSGGGDLVVPSDLINKPGTFMMIPVRELKVDSEYQRSLAGSRVDKMSDDWSWVACGSITVALRGPGSGDYYVIEGQHRVAAAERAGIVELPCMVFESLTHIDEAHGFLDTNTARRAMSVIDRYRALLVVGDPTALRVRELLAQANRTPGAAGGVGGKERPSAGREVSCLDYMMSAVALDDVVLTRLWPMVIEFCEGRLISKNILQGLFYLERFLVNTSLTERHWRRRLMQVGYDTVVKNIVETIAFEGKGGAAICAKGVLRALNRGLQRKLTIEINPMSRKSREESLDSE
jgi:hypothetical protein